MKFKTCLLLFCSYLTFAQKEIKLYNGPAPGSENWTRIEKSTFGPDSNLIVYNVVDPTLTMYLPEKKNATGTAMLIAPGGAFHILSMDSEGHKVAKMLQSKGVAAFVLKYRLSEIKTDNPFAEVMQLIGNSKKLDEINAPTIEMDIKDAQTALAYIRANAGEFDINTDKVGMMGFSAGGTLTLGTFYASPQNQKPNFIAPIYPYIPAVDYLKKVPTSPTPIFIALASDDQLGFAPANTQLYLDWHKAGNPAELHVYEKGGHGFGMNVKNIPTDTWHERLTDWMKAQGLLSRKHKADWEKPYTDLQLEEMAKAQALKRSRDFANLEKYREANAALEVPSKTKKRVVFTGDSITEGWVRADPEFFKENNFEGRGISGQTSPQTLLRFQQDVVELKPEVVVINIGINDIAENTGDYMEYYTLGNYKSMIAVAKANNIKVVLASVMPAYQFPWRKEIKDVPEKVISLNKGIKKLADENGLVYLDYFNALKDERNGLSKEMAGDGVHPTLPCYKIMEEMAKEAIGKAMAKK
jgi:acetyl esterase/lipase/lysophospholipase L1-like esterase